MATAGSPSVRTLRPGPPIPGADSLHPLSIVNDASIESLLKRGRRWKLTLELKGQSPVPPPTIVAVSTQAPVGARFRRSLPVAISFLTSTAVHMALLMGAAWVALSVSKTPPLRVLVQGSMVPAEAREIVAFEAPPAEASGDARSDEESLIATFAAVELDPGVMQGGSPELALVEFSDKSLTGRTADVAGLTDRSGNGRSTEGSGEGGGGGNPKGDDDAQFFGVQASGRKFVFVCDCSRSMAGTKWSELNAELARCIEDLRPDQSFYIIFFDGEMHPMFEPLGREPELLSATRQNVERAQYWLANVTLGRNTSPFESMKFGADLEPDTMFLLTDGEFGDYTAPYMRDFNKKRKAAKKKPVVVHTIGFFNAKHQLVLERIARDSGGTYKFVEAPNAKRKATAIGRK